MIQLAIHEAINGRDLDYAIARATMEEMMDGTATDIEMATLLTALRMKGETITEITACAEVMREKGAHIEPKGAVMDIVGTGGDEVGSFNISTTAAFVAAAGGVPVAKHGNRSVSSKSGAADVLEELGVVLSLTPEQTASLVEGIKNGTIVPHSMGCRPGCGGALAHLWHEHHHRSCQRQRTGEYRGVL